MTPRRTPGPFLQHESEIAEPAPYCYDLVNHRIVVADVYDDVFALNVATGKWITLNSAEPVP